MHSLTNTPVFIRYFIHHIPKSMQMAARISSLSFFIGAVFISCFAPTLSSDVVRNFESPALSIKNNIYDDFSYSHVFSPPIEAIYQFGDSYSDVGNGAHDDPTSGCAKFPYGESYFRKPTGRCSDGLLMIDYFAKFFELPFLDAYLNSNGNFSHGVNFAVGGATALDSSTLATNYSVPTMTERSLSVQLGWFKSHLDSICSNASDSRQKLSRALLFMGEIGGNDYNYAFWNGKSMPDAYQMVPEVVQAIKNAVKEAIELGATRLAIPGIYPIGCITSYLALFKKTDPMMYDELKCLKDFNTFSKYHDNLLKQALRELQIDHSNVTLIYLDYYVIFREIVRNPTSNGFDKNSLHKSCCGNINEDFNRDLYQGCGTDGAPLCQNPNEYMSWDGIHFTQHTYEVMAKWLMKTIVKDIGNAAI